MKVIDAMNFVKSKLETAMSDLPDAEKLIVEIPESIEDYKLSHPNGALLVVYRGAEFEQANVSGYTVQQRNMEIGVIILARHKHSGKKPEEYIDFTLDVLSGKDVSSKFNKQKKITAVSDEWIKEENGIWFYGVTFNFPTDFIEEDLR